MLFRSREKEFANQWNDVVIEFDKQALSARRKIVPYNWMETRLKAEFEEFVINNDNVPLQSTSNEQSSKISDLENQVVDLQSQLEVANQSLSQKDKTDVQVMAARDVIIQLRISNGQGKDPSQFSDQFPYELKT